MKGKWYLQTWFICLVAALWPIYGIPLVAAIILIYLQAKQNNVLAFGNAKLQEIDAMKIEAEHIVQDANDEEKRIIQQANGEAKIIIDNAKMRAENETKEITIKKQLELAQIQGEISKKAQYLEEVENIKAEYEKVNKQVESQRKKLSKAKIVYKSMENSINKYYQQYVSFDGIVLPHADLDSAEELSPTVTLKLHNMDVKDLHKAYNENEKIINDTLEKYKERYTTKANAAIYKLMVIALKAELQNILYNLKFDKLDKSIEYIKMITEKYLVVATEGNQSIANTMVKFIGQIEQLFINAIQIEYEYYVKKEREKAEQAAIRAQMRQEAEEKKALEQQRKQVEMEESKFQSEIAKVQEQIDSTQDQDKLNQLMAKISELQNQLDLVEHKKEDIINLQNGKAGHVYIISNVGSFGKDVFKIGMTRRIDPSDRVRELGDASVPFPFDVHSFIFSDDAVDLEKKLHQNLENQRVNKINLRKEFFHISLDELELLVEQIDPAAEFTRTILAEEYKQTLSLDELSMVS